MERPNDVLIKVHSCGMCGTDLATLEGRHAVNSPIILGHEVAGEVVKVGDKVHTVSPGDRVTVDPNVPCGVCTYCQSNRPSLCNSITSLGEHANAGYAEYLLAPQSAVFRFPESTPWDVIPLAEPLSDVLNGMAKVRLLPGESAVVYGAGPIGLLWLALLKRGGVGKLIAVEPRQKRAEAALKVGAQCVVDPTNVDPVREVIRQTDGRGADIAVEAIGKTETVESAIDSSAYGGRIVIMGRLSQDAVARFRPDIILRSEKKILGTFAGFGYVPLAIECLSNGFVDPDVFVTHRVPLDDIYRAVELNRKGEAIKTLIFPS
jgi:threonine dehydrogenase-like Zn-dependent dehydrogenase